jgi:hypothetical protein
MNAKQVIVTGLALMALAIGLKAQTQTTGTTKTPEAGVTVTTEKVTGEVVATEGNLLLARMQPSGMYRLFNTRPGQQFMIDGQAKLIADLRPGTVLNATAITRSQPVTLRTTATITGTVWYASGNFVILRLANGENREYNVPESYRFVVEGKPASVHDLRKGMNVTGTKITSEPQIEISTETVVTGKAPK